MTDVLILTPAPDEPRFAGSWSPLFERLAAPLRARGLSVQAASWVDADTNDARLVLPLLSWGYHLRAGEWFARLNALEAAGARLANPAPVLRWNTTKTYLADLASRGAPVVPTHAVDRLTMEALDHARDAFGVDVLVTKPQISGGSQDTVKLRHADGLAGCTAGPALIQPFLPAVGEEGELSLFYFDGVFSHAVTKVAVAGDFRVQPQFGGQVSGVAPEPEALHAAEMVLAAAGAPLTYARVDLIRGLDGTPQLMELEVIEPDLFLEHAHDDGAAFATAVMGAL
ncbi:transporter [Caulobacter sp. BK020]|uniref:ATP-grasp domain-containing protein n=1 Tax=Caulobacter sp. BK020 TaxID=2512117 RepID=UPI001049284D|nr:transporter [Caulobacter sp. BK020]